MNGIPLTFSEHQINRTILGGPKVIDPNALNISVILLNSSGSHFKLHVFENLLQCNFQSIVSVEHDSSNFTDDVVKRFPMIKFLVPLEKTSDGDLINLAMSEVQSDYVLVIRDSLNIPTNFIPPHLADRLTADSPYCIVPRLFDSNKNSLPCAFSPSAEKNHFVIDSSSEIANGKKTLFPFDYIALYNRKKFIELGGFDWTITSPYWQNLDLAIRSWLWGEQTVLTSLLQFSYIDEPPVNDTTWNLDYLRYYLKNETPKIKMEQGYIKKSTFFVFLGRSSCGLVEARKLFNAAKIWVNKNKFRFKMDLQSLVQNWSEIDEDK